MAVLLIVLGGISLIVVLNIYQGWALSVIWNWFVPVLGGPSISIPIAVGISCIVSMVMPTHHDDENVGSEMKTKRLLMALLKPLLKPLLLILVAWFFHLFVPTEIALER